MIPLAIALTIFGLSFAAAIGGMALHAALPEGHINSDSKDVVKLVMGVIATMAALVLSLLIASAHSFYDAQRSELQSLSAQVMLVDRMLTIYGPETKSVRDRLRDVFAGTHDAIWPTSGVPLAGLDPRATQRTTYAFIEALQSLAPKTDAQRGIRSQAMQASESIGKIRLLMFAQSGGSISWPFLFILAFWICVLFLGFGLFARFNATVTVALLVGALSVAGAVFLILELSDPYSGLLRLSDAPFRSALAQIDQ